MTTLLPQRLSVRMKQLFLCLVVPPDAPQLYDCKEEEVLTVQQLCNQEWNSSLDQEEQDAAQVKEEEEKLCSSQEEEDFGLKQETDTLMVTPADEDNDKSETEANSEQLLSHNSADTESKDQGAGKNVKPGSSKHEEPKKRLDRNRSDHNSVDNFSMSENQCDTDTGEESVKCSDNDKGCKNESQKEKPHTVKSYVCNTCGKRFRQKHHLSSHERIHTGEKPFCCETCGQSFNQRGTLKIHMRIHTGEKPFSCETCGQKFNSGSTLKTHMRRHTGEKPFCCETCGKRFDERGTLKKHTRIHTGEKPFSCETCGQRFNRLESLKTHMRIHTDKRLFSTGPSRRFLGLVVLSEEEKRAVLVQCHNDPDAPTNKTFLGDHQYPTLEWKMDHPDAVSGPQWQKELGPLQNELLAYVLDKSRPPTELIVKDGQTCLTREDFWSLALSQCTESNAGNARL
ncbi:uncharacterized protein KZ484_012061 [Pholidichthys leucotaenia]